MRTTLVCEIATAHGGDVDLAADMIRAAADSGADMAKLQSYSRASINPEDPQAAWLSQSHLDKAAHARLLRVGEQCGITVFSTPFDSESLQMLRDLGLKTFKVASSESGNDWWQPAMGESWIVSYPWGIEAERVMWERIGRPERVPRLCQRHTRLTAIPLYPTPLECVGRAPFLDGWSDHCVGLSACYRAIAHGAKMVEAHFCLPKRSRERDWDKRPHEFELLRQFAEDMATVESGVGQVFRARWKR